MAVLTLAGLTIREAMRKWLFIAGLLIALLFFLLAFVHIPIGQGLDGEQLKLQQDNVGKTFAWLGCGMIKFFSSVLAITLAAGAISAEVERGVLSAIVPKPLSRASIYLGKWLGFVTIIGVSMLVWGLMLALVVWIQTHTFHWHIFTGVLAVGLFPLLFITLTLFFSSFSSFALSAVLSLIAAGISLTENLLLLLAKMFDADILTKLSHAVSYIVPISRMNHWITKGLGDAGYDVSATTNGVLDTARIATNGADLAYILAYIAAFMVLGLLIFHRRDL